MIARGFRRMLGVGAVGLLAGAIMLAAPAAQARVVVGFGIGPAYYPPPVVYAPPPVYVPPPTYYYPPPAYYYPPPAYYYPPAAYGPSVNFVFGAHRHW